MSRTALKRETPPTTPLPAPRTVTSSGHTPPQRVIARSPPVQSPVINRTGVAVRSPRLPNEIPQVAKSPRELIKSPRDAVPPMPQAPVYSPAGRRVPNIITLSASPAPRQPRSRPTSPVITSLPASQPSVVHPARTPVNSNVGGNNVGANINYQQPYQNELVAKVQAIPAGHQILHTAYGSFVIPDYSLMTPVQLARERQSYVTKFQQLNKDWNHLDVSFPLPSESEDVENIAVRYKQAEKYILTQTGTDFWYILLCVGWAAIEYGLKRLGLNGTGYADSQMKLYKLYQSQLTKMGETSGFGQEWPPMVQIFVTAAANALLFVLLGLLHPKAQEYSTQVMGALSQMISGHNQVEMSEAGTPKPSKGPSSIFADLGLEGMSLSQMLSMGMAYLGGGKKKTKEERAARRKARQADPDDL